MQSLVYKESQFEIDSLSNRRLPQHWCDVVASPCVSDESRRCILDRLEVSEQTVCDAAEQSITVVETTGYKALHQRLCCIDGQ